ncbi:helix-turn-helix domain-containing protein [Amaricoccus sp.]|uniref:helix-turn-helix domain-containing protein n=1 Tax=Amaricoccus sp. TaxID=1872485 RepID=UPI002613D277|nr:helix-turn-helix transcriptional regulator [Amaricoccus sp.]HRO10589.1 short-chain fatty acyl-CoA regulator family protein [Amaricoccus sp.]
MPKAIVGTRIRERRRALGITQVELSRRIGISASYLNLIERNKRGIAGSLLRRTAAALELGLDDLDGAAERRLLETLTELAHAPDLAALGAEAASAGELIGAYPGWARSLAALARSERAAASQARALADRLTHDPFLGEAVHRMLTHIAAVRSAAEIMTDYPDLPADRRASFLAIVHDESRALTGVAEALAAYFDKAEETQRALTPVDEVEALFDARANRFDEIETAAAGAAARFPEGGGPHRAAAARALAERALGVAVEAVIARQPEIETAPARARARRALLDYAAAAILAPLPAFAPRAGELGYDLEALAGEFALDAETVCRRLLALSGEGVPRFGYFRVNAAGTLIERRGLAGLVAPRYAPACPLWVLYRAQQSPETVMRQRALFPNGERFVFLARARRAGPTGFGRPRHYLTDMLALSEADARLTVYAPDPGAPVEEVGPACRLCPRQACPHRVDDPLAG